MPFRSTNQVAYLYANKPALAKKFAKETKNIKSLPKKVTKTKTPKRSKK